MLLIGLGEIPYELRIIPLAACCGSPKSVQSVNGIDSEMTRASHDPTRVASDLQRPTESPGGVVRLRTVVVGEDVVIPAITKNRAAEFSNRSRCVDPA